MSQAIDWGALRLAAEQAATRAHAPYSKFRVGAALLCEDGAIVAGCNVENASYGLTQCAERNAICAAVALGHARFLALAISTATDAPVSPCGACRQVLAEFAPSFPVHAYCASADVLRSTTEALLPHAFGKQSLG